MGEANFLKDIDGHVFPLSTEDLRKGDEGCQGNLPKTMTADEKEIFGLPIKRKVAVQVAVLPEIISFLKPEHPDCWDFLCQGCFLQGTAEGDPSWEETVSISMVSSQFCFDVVSSTNKQTKNQSKTQIETSH